MYKVILEKDFMKSVSSKWIYQAERIKLSQYFQVFVIYWKQSRLSKIFYIINHSIHYFRGRLPTADQILQPGDSIELKKCIYASQV
jgi:hypothetical protein